MPLNPQTRQTLGTGVKRALALLRPACHVLMAPHAVVLDTGSQASPLVRQCHNFAGTLEEQFGAAAVSLLQLVDESGCRGRRLHLVVSDFWARPLVLPMAGNLPSDEDIDAVLHSQYRRTYGDWMGAWHWCWDRQGARLVAVAWPTVGLVALQEGLARHGGVLATAKPLAVDVASALPPAGGPGWVAIVESQSFTLVRQLDVGWQTWCVTPGSADLAHNLPLQLARECARFGDGCRSVTLIDLYGRGSINNVKLALADAGWSVTLRASNEPGASVARRLLQAIPSRSTA